MATVTSGRRSQTASDPRRSRRAYWRGQVAAHERSGLSVAAFCADFRGYLRANAYAGYDALYATGRVVEVGCWAHARRYFWDAKAADEPRALLALAVIRQLYRVEAEGKDSEVGARRALRRAPSNPILDRFKTWLD